MLLYIHEFCVYTWIRFMCVLCSCVLYVCVYVYIFMTMHECTVVLVMWVRKGLSLKPQLAIFDKLASKPLNSSHLLILSTGATDVLPHLAFRQHRGLN